jgi:hypothetical protein
LSLRYRKFRRAMRAEGRWYEPGSLGAQDVQPAELDLIILGILSQAREMTTNATLMARLGDNRPTLLEAAAVASQPSSGG